MEHEITCPQCGQITPTRSKTITTKQHDHKNEDFTFETELLSDKDLLKKLGLLENTSKAEPCPKLYLLLDLFGGDLPELDDIPNLPQPMMECLENADRKMLMAILMETVGRWEAIEHPE